jgi:hypothetical protein
MAQFYWPEEPHTVRITKRVDLGSDETFDEIAMQILSGDDDVAVGIATYEESRRGRMDDELWHHTAYFLDQSLLEKAVGLLSTAPPDVQKGTELHAKIYAMYKDIRMGNGFTLRKIDGEADKNRDDLSDIL